MTLVVSGLLNKQVGGELGITRDHGEGAPRQVMRKMKADSLPELVTMAARLGLRSATFTPSNLLGRRGRDRVDPLLDDDIPCRRNLAIRCASDS
jgi:hypothetical protein